MVPASSFPLAFFVEQTTNGISLWAVQVSCPVCILSQGLAHPQPAGEGKCWRDCAVAVPALLSSNQSTGVLSMPLKVPTHNTAL